VDLSTIWYRIYDNARNRWATGNMTYLKNKWTNKLTVNGTSVGDRTISLEDGKYTLFVWGNSTGWGDENLYTPKMVNTGVANVSFSISTAPISVAVGLTIAVVSGCIVYVYRRKRTKRMAL